MNLLTTQMPCSQRVVRHIKQGLEYDGEATFGIIEKEADLTDFKTQVCCRSSRLNSFIRAWNFPKNQYSYEIQRQLFTDVGGFCSSLSAHAECRTLVELFRIFAGEQVVVSIFPCVLSSNNLGLLLYRVSAFLRMWSQLIVVTLVIGSAFNRQGEQVVSIFPYALSSK
jgi:hypothetical protein